MGKWFSYSPENGFCLHNTEEEAKKTAGKEINMYRDAAFDDGWDDDVKKVCWGKVRESAQVTYKQEFCHKDELDCDCDKEHTTADIEGVEYGLCPV